MDTRLHNNHSPDNLNSQSFHKSLLGYNSKEVDEFINELSLYCWDLQAKIAVLEKDLSIYQNLCNTRKTKEKSYCKWKEFEYTFLLGKALQKEIVVAEENVIFPKNTVITSYLINTMIEKGLYGELIEAASPTKSISEKPF